MPSPPRPPRPRGRTVLALVPALALWIGCAATPVTVSVERDAGSGAAVLEALQLVAASGRPDERAAYRDGVWDPAYFDSLIAVDSLSIEGLRHRHRRAGAGIPLVGLRAPDASDAPHYPPEGIVRPVTAVVVADGEAAPALRLLDPVRHASVATPDGPTPVAADFSAPYALLLSRTRLARTGLAGTLRAEALDERAGIYLLEPYDPEKTPLLMVHGLLASPLTWRELTNAVLGDEALRARYQVWHAIYATGIPYLHAAADFRAQLRALRQRLDPEGDDFATRNLVVVAHSKGGLLAKTLVTTSGDRLWDAAFTVSPAELQASPEDRTEMGRALFFQRDPAVRRVVFIATPHRGSRVSENPLARLLASWIQLPGRKRGPFERVVADNEEHLTPGFELRRESGLPSGPRALSHRDPLIHALADLPVDPAVPFHTILGEIEPGAGSDGVVDHASSHLPGAASVLVVEDGHSVHQSEEAVAEVLRILRVDAGSETPGLPPPRAPQRIPSSRMSVSEAS